jgi:putative DNA primase
VIESGLFVSPTRDKFFGRVIFPIANTMGNTVAFTGRILQNGEPKYLNSPASRIFDKSSILYGLHLAKQTIARTTEVFIVEGQMDTISLHQAGVTNAVGISGTALTQDHIRILKRFAKIIYLALDADSAGVKATFLSIENLLNSDLEIRVILIPEGKDPDEFIKSGGDFEALKGTSLSVVDYFIKMGGQEYNLNTLVGQKQLIEKCLELVAHISSPIEVDFYMKKISEIFRISRSSLYDIFTQKKRTVQSKQNQPTQKIQKFSPNIFSLLGAFITKFSLFDLFFEKFAYTVEDIFSLPDA